MLGGGGERKETQVRLLTALGHAAEELFQVSPAFLGRAFPGLYPKLLPAQHFLEIGGRLAALRAVRLVDDDGAPPGGERARTGRPAFLGHLEQLARDEREFLQCGDDQPAPAFSSASASCRELASIRCTTPSLCSN